MAIAIGAPRDLLAGTKLAAMPGFAGRQTDTGEEIEIEFTPDNSSLVFAASTNRHMAAYAFPDSQLFIADLDGRRAAPDDHAAWIAGRCRASRRMASI